MSYSNQAKQDMLGVPGALIVRHGAVSEAVARAMAEGALRGSVADLAVAVTGIAGPGGGSPEKPVGLVHLACAARGGDTAHERHIYPGTRAAIRLATVETAFDMILARLA